jgi:hypothetical protein
VDRLYPCHVCYAVFEAGEELRAHFAAAHPPGTLNRSASTLVHESYYRGKCGADDRFKSFIFCSLHSLLEVVLKMVTSYFLKAGID